MEELRPFGASTLRKSEPEGRMRKLGILRPAVELPAHFLRCSTLVECWIEILQEQQRLVVRLAGRLGEAQVAALVGACLQTKMPPRLELGDLVSADSMGIDALLRLEQRGAQLIGLPTSLRLKLDDKSRDRLG